MLRLYIGQKAVQTMLSSTVLGTVYLVNTPFSRLGA